MKEKKSIHRSKEEEKLKEAYIKIKSEETPDLWNRIENRLEQEEKNSKEEQINVKVNKKKRWMVYFGATAAVFLCSILVASQFGNKKYSENKSMESPQENQMVSQEDMYIVNNNIETKGKADNSDMVAEDLEQDRKEEESVTLILEEEISFHSLEKVEKKALSGKVSNKIEQYIAQLPQECEFYQNDIGELFVWLENKLYLLKEKNEKQP